MPIKFPFFSKRHLRLTHTVWLFGGNFLCYLLLENVDIDPYTHNELWHSSELEYRRSRFNFIRKSGI